MPRVLNVLTALMVAVPAPDHRRAARSTPAAGALLLAAPARCAGDPAFHFCGRRNRALGMQAAARHALPGEHVGGDRGRGCAHLPLLPRPHPAAAALCHGVLPGLPGPAHPVDGMHLWAAVLHHALVFATSACLRQGVRKRMVRVLSAGTGAVPSGSGGLPGRGAGGAADRTCNAGQPAAATTCCQRSRLCRLGWRAPARARKQRPRSPSVGWLGVHGGAAR